MCFLYCTYQIRYVTVRLHEGCNDFAQYEEGEVDSHGFLQTRAGGLALFHPFTSRQIDQMQL